MASAKALLDRFIAERLDGLSISLREFARRVGVSHVFVVHVKSGKAPLPGDQFPKWCEVLELDEKSREEFLRITLIAQAPPDLQKFIRDLESKRWTKS